MKNFRKALLPIAITTALVGCQVEVGSEHRELPQEAVRTIAENQVMYDSVSTLGEVNWYKYGIKDDNKIITVDVESNTRRADVDLLTSVYRMDGSGNLERIFADHAPEDSLLGASIQIAYQFQQPETIYVSVRDFLDDEASDSQYQIKISEGAHDNDNDTFSGAQIIDVECTPGKVESIGDVDTFRLEISQSGVYQFSNHFNAEKDSPVQLYMQLFDSQFSAVRNTSLIENGSLHMSEVLDTGTYYVTVEDYGRDAFDLSSPYELCITKNQSVEYHSDDSINTAQSVSFDNNMVSMQGELSYNGDQDWFSLPAITNSNSAINVFNITLGANNASTDVIYELKDSLGNIAFSYVQRAGSGSVTKQIKVSEGQYLVSVSGDQNKSGELPSYSIDIVNTQVNDSAELSSGDNTLETAHQLSLPDSGLVEGKISYLGDMDWYRVDVSPKTSAYQNLQVWLSSDDESTVQYQVQIIQDEVIQTHVDPISTDNILDVHSSVLIEPGSNGDTQRFYIKISDKFAHNSSDQSRYYLQVKVDDVQNSLSGSTPSGVSASNVIFHSEQTEQNQLAALTAPILNIEHNGFIAKQYYANDNYFAFLNPEAMNSKVVRATDGETTVITLPWVAGYVDYADDQDWFKLDLGALDTVVNDQVQYLDEDWYYDVAITIKSAANQETEYQWRLYRDNGSNESIRDRANINDGFFATNGDDTLEAGLVDITTSQAATGDKFYIGSRSSGTVYLSVFDANFVKRPSDKSINPATDTDWSTPTSPYYVQITLTYHAGVDAPQ